MSASAQPINEAKLHEFMMKAVGEMGAAMNAALILVGDKLGIYKAMAGSGPMSSEEIAAKTKTHERYVREWLAAQSAGGFITYDSSTKTYTLPPEQALALADENSPVFLPGFFEIVSACIKDESKVTEAFRTGKGPRMARTRSLPVRRHRTFLSTELSCSSDRRMDSRPWRYRMQIKGWGKSRGRRMRPRHIHNIDGAGLPEIHVCWIRLPSGVDRDGPEAAATAGVSDRVKFEVASAKEYPGEGYQLVAFFDCLHDMGDPEGAARHVRKTLDPGGAWMIVEPFANDKLEDNLNPIGRVFYAASTMLCTPASLSQEVGLGLGAQAGEARLIQNS